MSNTIELAGNDGALPSRQELADWIDRFALSADVKAILNDIAAMTVDVGGKLIAAGRRIVAFIRDAVAMFPNTAFGMIAAFVVASLVAAVPFLGPLLAPILTPLLIAFGLTKGAIADIENGVLRTRVKRLEDAFVTLAPTA